MITGIADSDRLSAIPVKEVPVNDPLDEIYMLALTMRFVSATVLTPDGGTMEKSLRVDWGDILNAIDSAVVGAYAAVGTIVAPDGYRFAEGVLTEIQIPVHVVELSSPFVITAIDEWYPYADALAVLQGGDPEEIARYFAESPLSMKCYDADGKFFAAPIQWDFSGIDTSTVGLYQAVGTVLTPENAAFSDELTLPTPRIPVSVQAAGRPDINCFFTGRGEFSFPWVAPPGDLSNISVWLSENDGAWTQLEKGIYIGADQFCLQSSVLTKGSSYRLQVDYDGGRTNLLSFTYDDVIRIDNYAEGDRDGGDAGGSKPDGDHQQKPPTPEGGGNGGSNDNTGGNDNTGSNDNTGGNENGSADQPVGDREPTDATPPTVIPPSGIPESGDTSVPGPSEEAAPQPEGTQREQATQPLRQDKQTTGQSGPIKTEPSSGDADFAEVFGENHDLISGTRLRLMLESTGAAQFTKQGITVRFSADTLNARQIQEGDRIAVTVEKEGEDTVFLAVSINDVPLSDLPDTQLMAPYQAADEEAALLLTDEQGRTVAQGDYDPALEVASFQVDTLGRFTITEQAAPEQAAPLQADTPAEKQADDGAGLWVLASVAGAALVAGGVWLLWKRRRTA